jgi:peptidoglycan/xylan/chitin deacetylase (PgdA/CDA1 family)
MRITLTFDNGPTAEATPTVLDTLAQHGAHAVFFVVGRRIEDPALRDLAARAKAEGHLIGNHTYSHARQFGDMAAPADSIDEIDRTQALLGDLAGPERLFRPYGRGGTLDHRLLNRVAVDHLRAGKFTMALWTCVPRDWEDPDGWPDRALAECAASPWPVVVLHDLPTGAMAHLDQFLGALRDQGAELRTDFPADSTPMLRGRLIGDINMLSSPGVLAAHQDQAAGRFTLGKPAKYLTWRAFFGCGDRI